MDADAVGEGAKRGAMRSFVPITVDLPFAPTPARYFWVRWPLSATEPERARPMPSRIDFLPTAMTSFGRSFALVFTMNSATARVRPGTSGKASKVAAFCAMVMAFPRCVL